MPPYGHARVSTIDQDQNKTSRLDARITPEPRDQLRYVAARQGHSVSDYVSTALHQAVQQDVADGYSSRRSRHWGCYARTEATAE